jgi:predicted P-loop ATPase/GTPase
VVGSRYLHALGDGNVPLAFMFSGTIFTKGTTGFAVENVPWNCDASYVMPVAVWRQVMDLHYPGTGWVRLDRDLVEELATYRARHGLTTWDETLQRLLDHARVDQNREAAR